MSWLAGTVPGPAWLFCPADRPERYSKAAAVADVVILDLEDAVALDHKPAAREALVQSTLDPTTTVVRVNPVGTREHELDLLALAETQYTCVMLPKCVSVEQITSLAPRAVIALIESPAGAINVGQLASADNAVGLMWGAEDLIASLGGKSSRFDNGAYREVARNVRSTTLLAAKAHGRFALDSVYLDIDDADGLRHETDDAVASGFDGKVAIHPRQTDIVRTAFVPNDAEIAWARSVLEHSTGQSGVFVFEGRMIDAPVIKQGQRILALANMAAQASRPNNLPRGRQ